MTTEGTNIPAEVAPLREEINALLDVQDRELIRSRDRAADLAYGSRTPQTAFSGDIVQLRAKGQDAIAGDIDALAGRMRRHV